MDLFFTLSKLTHSFGLVFRESIKLCSCAEKAVLVYPVYMLICEMHIFPLKTDLFVCLAALPPFYGVAES